MRDSVRLTTMVVCVLITAFCLISCEKKKEGKVIVSEQEFSLRKDGTVTYSLDAKGKIKNVGKADVKKVVVTGYCRSCSEMVISGQWFFVNDLQKTPNQKDTINYLKAGAEAEFSFQGIAFYYGKKDEKPQGIPDKLEIVIESFEVAN